MTADLTKISFNAIRKAVVALENAAKLEGLSRTDVLNRAIQVYELVAQVQHEGSKIIIARPDGRMDHVRIL